MQIHKRLLSVFLFIFIALIVCSGYFFSISKNNFILSDPGSEVVDLFERSIRFASSTQSGDLDADGALENYTLQQGKLQVKENNTVVWETPSDWQVKSFILADATNDGVVDINMSVWKPGNFGSSRPFWVKENDMSIKNHFFIFDFTKDRIIPVWQSSNLDNPNCAFAITDIDKDGDNDLLVIEGEYGSGTDCQGIYLALWKWNLWGFSNEWRSRK